MPLVRDFRFSFNVFTVGDRDGFLDTCRNAERWGYDAVFAADHIGAPAPFSALSAAAAATERLRVGTLVLNIAFWNPHLLAREVATLDRLSNGRFELGLGVGHVRQEFDAAGVAWEPYAARVKRLTSVIAELRTIFSGEAYEAMGRMPEPPMPLQRDGRAWPGPPLLVGGFGDPVLQVAAEHADIVSVIGVSRDRSNPAGGFRLEPTARVEERLRLAREAAGDRAESIEWHTMVQHVAVTQNSRAAAEELIARMLPSATVEEVLDSPFILIGTVPEIVARLRENRRRYGFSHLTVHRPYVHELARVIEHLREGKWIND